MLDVNPDFARRMVVEEAPDNPFDPTIELRSDLIEAPIILQALTEDGVPSADGHLYFTYRWLESQASIEDEIKKVLSPQTLLLVASAGDEEVRVPATAGASGELSKASLKVEVLGYFGRFQLGEDAEPASHPSADVNPWVRIEVTAGARSRKHYVFARHPDFAATHGDNLPGYRLRLIAPADLGAKHGVLIFEGEHMAPTMLHISGSEVLSTIPLTKGNKVFLEGTGDGSIGNQCCPDGPNRTQAYDDHWLTLVGSYRRPSFRTEVLRRSEAWVNPAALLEVSGPEGRTGGWAVMYGSPFSRAARFYWSDSDSTSPRSCCGRVLCGAHRSQTYPV